MRLNPDCIRDILLYIEDHTDYNIVTVSVNDMILNFKDNYDENTIYYHIAKIHQAKLVDDVSYPEGRPTDVTWLSWEGHELLSNIRGETVWNHTKSVAGKIGSFSLDTLSKIATGVITQLISKQLTGH